MHLIAFYFILLVGSVEEALSDESEIFQERLGVPKPAQDTDIVFHCAAGVRSVVAIEIAHKLGYSKYVLFCCYFLHFDWINYASEHVPFPLVIYHTF